MFEIDKKKFGAFVLELRKEKGYTQKELAERLFLSDKAISKWETGVSIPDITLLIPLAELLGVSATELLRCERMPERSILASEEVEAIVKTAIVYSEETPVRSHQEKRKWAMIYTMCIMLGGFGLGICYFLGSIFETVVLALVFGGVFGGYFCFLAKHRLPDYYDDNRIGGVFDGFFRINIPGVSINNSNWPYLVLVGRVWSCSMAALYPMLSALMLLFAKNLWLLAERYVFLILVLGGLFVPMYCVGKRWEE